MANDTETAQVSLDSLAAHVISATVECQDSTGDDIARALHDVLQGLPSHIVKDLVSLGVCCRCIFRLFGTGVNIYSCSSLSPSILSSVLREHEDSSRRPTSEELEVEAELCTLCLGILQFTYCDDKEMVVKKSANDMAVAVSELVKREGYQIDSFSLEVSIPPLILENEHLFWLYMKSKYGSELWFQGRSLSQCISAKDALKFYLTQPLEALLDCKSGMSAFRIRLTYTHSKASKMVQSVAVSTQGCKRKNTGTGNSADSIDDCVVGVLELGTLNALV